MRRSRFSEGQIIGMLKEAEAGMKVADLPHNLPSAVNVAVPFLVFLVEAGWYSVVALALSAESSRAVYVRSKAHVDRVAGGVIGLLGLKLVTAARPAP